MKSIVRERFHYEIAMSIGNSLDLGVMLKEGLPTYLRKFNCLAGAVLRREVDDDELSSFVPVYAIPKRMKRNNAVKLALEQVPGGFDVGQLNVFLTGLPTVGGGSGYKSYLMELPGFGLLLLVKSAPGFSRPDLKSLAPLNLKLAEACLSCDANDRLQSETLERKRAEEKYKAIFDNAVEGIFQSTLDGRFINANPAMAKLLGYDSPESLIAEVSDMGRQLYVYPENRERLISRLLNTGRVSGFEVEYYRKDGSVGWMSMSARIICDDEGSPLHVEGMAEDVTARKQAVIALREAKQEAERLSRMKSNFLSMVSHELRTPLTSILGFAKISRKRLGEIVGRKSECPEDVSRGLDRIGSNTGVIIAEGERLTELINNVLDLSNLEAGHFEWHMGDVVMNDVLTESLSAAEVLFKDANLALVQDVSQDLPIVTGDRERLVQVFINLFSNAVKFTEEGVVTVSAIHEKGEVVVRVSDTGIGVPDEEVEVIFDKFRQLGNTLTDKPKGTGLGLPICKEIVEHHGGRIWVEPSEQGGSVFVFTIPIKFSPPGS